MKAIVEVSAPVVRTPRVLQLEGMFDVPPTQRAARRWDVDLPLEERPWSIGLIVGPSGSGKTTVARHLFPEQIARADNWPDGALLDGFPGAMGIKEIVELLSSVGFSSPPNWVRPFATLSNGEKFRASMARVLAESPDLAVVDEFTSVVDRTVARVGSCAIARTVRRRGQKFVAVSCHDDIEEWLQPDWVYRPDEQRFMWRSLQRRPGIPLTIQRVHSSAWRIFKHHHYLSAEIHHGATCFVAFWGTTPVAFAAWLPFVGKLKDARRARRAHRIVCLPDYQGVGIGNSLVDWCSSLWAGLGNRVFYGTGHPGEIAHRARNPKWVMTRSQSFTHKNRSAKASVVGIEASRANLRLTASFEYVGPKMPPEEALTRLNDRATVTG